MTEDQTENRLKAVEQLQSLRDAFKQAATDALNDNSLWPKRFSKKINAKYFNDLAECTQETIDSLESGKTRLKVFFPFSTLRECVTAEAENSEECSRKRLSIYKHDDKKCAAQFKTYKEKVASINSILLALKP